MQENYFKSSDHYDELTARQIDQYKETEIMHDLPLIYDYWSKKHLSQKSAAVTGQANTVEFYADYFQRSLNESDSNFLVSVGSGDCSIEIGVVKSLLSRQQRNFFFICLELSPPLIARARKKIDEEGLGDIITVAQTDLNSWQPRYKFAGVMAHHSLHHILNLEHLFELIRTHLSPNGRFLTCDIIGRNGHMRWPEALILLRKIWARMPRKYKYNHQFNKFDDYFDNWDCSNEGFEGIRAEDILPLLVNTFSFECFFCFGNLTDPFLDRGFGPNYDPTKAPDTAFIDYLHETNEQLISEGILKPTSMVTVMRNEKMEPRIYKHWSPQFAIRDPHGKAPEYDILPFLERLPFTVSREDEPLVAKGVEDYKLNSKLVFSARDKASQGLKYLGYGWSSPEDDFTWSQCEEASIVFPLRRDKIKGLFLSLQCIPYQSMSNDARNIEIIVNAVHVKTVKYADANEAAGSVLDINIDIPPSLLKDAGIIEISFQFPGRRRPQFEGGNDVRALGMALISASLSDRR